MPTKYDPSVIQEFADRLYKQADMIMYTYAVRGFVLGGVVGCALSFAASSHDTPFVPGLIGGLVVGALAALAGRERGFALRLQAQTALCQAQIELNSRRQ